MIRIKAAGRAFCARHDLTPTPRENAAKEELDYLDAPAGGRRGTRAWELGESRIALDREGLRESVHRWLWMWSYRKPIVAQVHGYCLAGGNELVGACDIIFAADDAMFGHPASRALGIPPTLGMWPAKIGMLKTKEILFTGEMVSGREAERVGMINRAVAPAALDQETMAFCRKAALAWRDEPFGDGRGAAR